MPTVILEKTASIGKIIEINKNKIKIDYYQNDPKCPYLIYGGHKENDKTKVYIIELRGDPINGMIHPGRGLLSFKVEVRGAELYLNNDIPNQWELYLPSHMPTCITGNLGRNIVIYSQNSLVVLGNVGVNTTLKSLRSLVLGIIETPSIDATGSDAETKANTESRAFTSAISTPSIATAASVTTASSSTRTTITSSTNGETIPDKRQKMSDDNPPSTLLSKSSSTKPAPVKLSPKSLPNESSSPESSVARPDDGTPLVTILPPKDSLSRKRKGTNIKPLELNLPSSPNTASVATNQPLTASPATSPNLTVSQSTWVPNPVFRNLFLPKTPRTPKESPQFLAASTTKGDLADMIPKALTASQNPDKRHIGVLDPEAAAASMLSPRKFIRSPRPKTSKLSTLAGTSTAAMQISTVDNTNTATKAKVKKPNAIQIKNNISNAEQRKLGNERLKSWLALRDKEKAANDQVSKAQAFSNKEVEEGEILEEEETIVSEIEPHQLNAFKEYLVARENGIDNPVLEWATGAGKTFFFSKLPEITGEKFFIGVPLINLEDQTAEELQKFCPTLVVGKLRDCANSTKEAVRAFFQKHDVVIGTYQRLRVNRSYEILPFDIISTFVLDEAHNGLTQKTEELVQFAKSKGCFILSVTATPRIGKKSNKRDNVYHFNGFNDPILKESDGFRRINPLTPFTIREAIDQGICAPVITALIVPDNAENVNFKRINSMGEETAQTDATKISTKDTARAIDRAEFNNIIVDFYMNGKDTYFVNKPSSSSSSNHNGNNSNNDRTTILGAPFRGEQGMVYCAGIKHSNHMAEAFNKVPLEVFDKENRFIKKYEDNIYFDKVETCRKSYERKKKANSSLELAPFALTKEQEEKLRAEALKEATTGKTKFCIAKAIHSKLSKEERRTAIKQFKLGGFMIAVGDKMLSEGLNHPAASLIFMTSNIFSESALLQKAGRGGRKLRGAAVPAEKEKIWKVFNVVWPTLKKTRYFYQYISENSVDEPKFTRGNDKIDAIRIAYQAQLLGKSKSSSSQNPVVSLQDPIVLPVPVEHQPKYKVHWEANAEVKKILDDQTPHARTKSAVVVSRKKTLAKAKTLIKLNPLASTSSSSSSLAYAEITKIPFALNTPVSMQRCSTAPSVAASAAQRAQLPSLSAIEKPNYLTPGMRSQTVPTSLPQLKDTKDMKEDTELESILAASMEPSSFFDLESSGLDSNSVDYSFDNNEEDEQQDTSIGLYDSLAPSSMSDSDKAESEEEAAINDNESTASVEYPSPITFAFSGQKSPSLTVVKQDALSPSKGVAKTSL